MNENVRVSDINGNIIKKEINFPLNDNTKRVVDLENGNFVEITPQKVILRDSIGNLKGTDKFSRDVNVNKSTLVKLNNKKLEISNSGKIEGAVYLF